MMEQNYQENFSKKTDSLNYYVTNNIIEIIKLIETYNYQQTIKNYKPLYEYELENLKELIKKAKKDADLTIINIFEKQISLIEKTVQIENNILNDFYKKQSRFGGHA